jgi:hypothetical protein
MCSNEIFLEIGLFCKSCKENMEDKTDYRIESLAEIFLNHARECEIDIEKQIVCCQHYHPNDPLPEYMIDRFNLAKALSVMANEIARIKNAIGMKDI